MSLLVESRRPIAFSELRAARALFGGGERGRGLFRMAIERGWAPKELLNFRKEFSPKAAGTDAFYTAVLNDCEAVVGEDGTMCGQRARMTLDIDARAHVNFFPVCGEEHASTLERRIEDELWRQEGRTTIPSRNGWGRDIDFGVDLKRLQR